MKGIDSTPHQSCDFWKTSLLGCYTVSIGKYQQFRGVQCLQYVYYLSVNRAQYSVRPESSALLRGSQFSHVIFCTCTKHFHHTAFTGILQCCMWSQNPKFYKPQRFITPSKSATGH